MKQSNDDSIFVWGTDWVEHRMRPDCNHGLIAWNPRLFKPWFDVYTAAAAEGFKRTWAGTSGAHNPSTTYDEGKHFLSLRAPVLSLAALPEISKTSFVRVDYFGRRHLGCSEMDSASIEMMFKGGKRVVAMLSCCYAFGHVGLVLERHEDGTYSRAHDHLPVSVQVSDFPQTQVMRIRHRDGLGDVCAPQLTSYGREFAEINVILVYGDNYSPVGSYDERRLGIHGIAATTRDDNYSILSSAPRSRVALLYRHQDGNSWANPNFVLGLRWDLSQASLRFMGITVGDNWITDADWANVLDWESEWPEPGVAGFSLGAARHVDVSIRKAPIFTRGQNWCVRLAIRSKARGRAPVSTRRAVSGLEDPRAEAEDN
jgi:hypothetical protein